MIKVIPTKTCLWKADQPYYEKGKVYDVIDDLALEMIEHGYATKVIEGKKQPDGENKMIDMKTTENKSVKSNKRGRPVKGKK